MVSSRLSEDPWPHIDQEPCARFCPGTERLRARGSARAQDGLTVHSAVWVGVAGIRVVAARARVQGRMPVVLPPADGFPRGHRSCCPEPGDWRMLPALGLSFC